MASHKEYWIDCKTCGNLVKAKSTKREFCHGSRCRVAYFRAVRKYGSFEASPLACKRAEAEDNP